MASENEISLRERIRLNLLDGMKNAGLNQVQLAEKLGISKATVNNWTRGNNSPDVDMVPQICKALGIAILDLYSPRENEPIELHSEKRISSSNLSEEAQQVAQDYSQLDQPGKNVVRVVIQEEGKRVKAEKEKRQVPAFEPQTVRRIPLYFTPAAAGMTSPAEGQDYEMIEVGKDVPWNADFAVKIDGESMEPYIRDGSTVYVNREPLENGDVGIFYVDGNMICKQYYKDEDGNVRLLSLNRACRYADRYISAKDTDTVMMYYGRVLLPRRPMVSWA